MPFASGSRRLNRPLPGFTTVSSFPFTLCHYYSKHTSGVVARTDNAINRINLYEKNGNKFLLFLILCFFLLFTYFLGHIFPNHGVTNKIDKKEDIRHRVLFWAGPLFSHRIAELPYFNFSDSSAALFSYILIYVLSNTHFPTLPPKKNSSDYFRISAYDNMASRPEAFPAHIRPMLRTFFMTLGNSEFCPQVRVRVDNNISLGCVGPV